VSAHRQSQPSPPPGVGTATYQEKKRADADARKKKKVADERAARIADLEGRIAQKEQEIRDLERKMSQPGFYDARETADAAVARHQSLMWEVGDLMNQWESLSASHEPE
jgi:hypothetical protein